DHLTRRGVAVLRVDDRGVGGSTGDTMKSTTADFAEDALAGVAFLRARPEIDGKRIGLCGHSEGGGGAPPAAARAEALALLLLLAGTAVTGEEVVLLQSSAILKAAGAKEDALTQLRRLQLAVLKVVKEEKDPAVLEKRAKKILEEEIARLTDEQKKEVA